MSTDVPRPERRPVGDVSSRTRDHLANLRTFMAWVRTALALIGLGFVVARMGLFLRQLAAEQPGALAGRRLGPGGEFTLIGIVWLGLGTVLAAWSGWHYQRTRKAIDAQAFEPPWRSAWVLTALVVLGGLVVMGLVLWRMVPMVAML